LNCAHIPGFWLSERFKVKSGARATKYCFCTIEFCSLKREVGLAEQEKWIEHRKVGVNDRQVYKKIWGLLTLGCHTQQLALYNIKPKTQNEHGRSNFTERIRNR
jgi:hypothetical protein